MKEKVKIWSRRRLLGAFLAFLGLAAVATAQNGTVNANVNCDGPMLTFTRTANQMAQGTSIPITFTGLDNSDQIFFVAAGGNDGNGGTVGQGNLASVTMSCGTQDNPIVIGANLQLGTGETPDALNNVSNFQPSANANMDAGIALSGFSGNVIVRATNIANAGGYTGGNYYLGVFVKDNETSCYSDVYYIKIQVVENIYAALTLRDAGESVNPRYVPNEYICNSATTSTNIGFTLCNLPATGTLSYTVNVANNGVAAATISGANVSLTGNTDGAIDNITYEDGVGVANATINSITPSTQAITINGRDYENAYTVQIGTQTLSNISAAVAGTAVYTFTDMTYTYKVDRNGDGDTDDAGETVVVPVVFESASGSCHSENNTFPTEFTVHVAPSFKVQALAYADVNERPTIGNDGSYVPGSGYDNTNSVFTAATTLSEPTFCQGTIAYLFGETSASEGKTTYAWANSIDPVAANNTTFTDAAIQNPNTAELTKFGNNAYTLLLTGTWNDLETGGHYGAGCQITDLMPINVTAAPILLLATDQVVTDGVASGDYNATDIITAPEQCPGTPILISTDKEGTPVTDGTGRTDAINAGNFIKHNNSNISWYVTTDADAAAYTAWRSGEITAVNETSALTIDANDTDDDTDLTHYFDNSNNANPAEVKNVTYTLYNANGCALVKSDGSSLTGGKVQIVFPVEPRPQFQLGAN